VIVGPDEDLETLSGRLEKVVSVPVIAQTGAQLALGRGAALASAESTGFIDTFRTPDVQRGERRSSRQNPYAGALTMLVAGAVAFVASLSLALGQHLIPDRATGSVQHVVHKAATPRVAQIPAPQPALVPPPAARPAPPPPPAARPAEAPAVAQQHSVISDEPPAQLPAAAPVPPPPPPQPVAPPPPPAPDPHPLLTKLLERLHGQQNPAPDQPAPAQGPPPNPGAPPP
jgi:hypothetical protein